MRITGTIKLIFGIMIAVLLLIFSAAEVFADAEPVEPGEGLPEEAEHIHSYLNISGVSPTCSEDGNIEYWTCTDCGAFFSFNGEVYTEIDENSWVIPALGHDFRDRVCIRCGAHDNGWVRNKDGTWSYYADYAIVHGWHEIAGKWYWFDENGIMRTGWQYADGDWYYLDPSGAMLRGWLKQSGIWYYLKSSGAMAVGWEKVNGIWYYFSDLGAMQTGWRLIDGDWYYLDPSGAMLKGWLKRSSIWYYLKSSGAMAVGWEKVNGSWYYFSDLGAMQTGWQLIDGDWYYLDPSGAMLRGWLKRSSIWYYLKSSGAMAVGWEKVNGSWYYFSSLGAMQTGWQLIDGYWYYFYNSGEMAADGIILDKWLIRDGKVDYDFTGIAADYDGSWYVTNGAIDSKFSGTVSAEGIVYNVNNGMVTGPVDIFYFGTMFSSIAKDGNIHFGTAGDKYEIECVHACYCDVHSWTNPSSGHQGVDLICDKVGQELLAVASGTVVYVHHQSYENAGSYGSHPGEAVAVDIGNGLIYEYHELKSNSVTVNIGDHVNAGDVIGKVGLTGVTTGYHIHLSVLYWLGAEYTDDLSKMPEYEGPSTDGYIQINPLFFFGESLAKETEVWYQANKYEWYGYPNHKDVIPEDPRNYPKLAMRIMGY